MNVITQFHSSAIPAAELNRIAAEFLALERTRIFRRLLVRRFGLLALATLVASVAFHWTPLVATVCSVIVFAAPPLCVWGLEIRQDHALTRRLGSIPGVAHVHAADAAD